MEFGSEYVFVSSKEEFEEVDERSLEQGLLSVVHQSSAANDDGEVGIQIGVSLTCVQDVKCTFL